MVLKLADESEPIVIDYREQAPQRANPDLFYRDAESFKYYAYIGHRSICVPGMVAGIDFA